MKAKASDWYKKNWTLGIKNMSWVENTSNEVDYLIDLCKLKGTERTRVYTLAEMKEIMEKRGMEMIEAFAGYTKIPASQHDFQMLVHSRKRKITEP